MRQAIETVSPSKRAGFIFDSDSSFGASTGKILGMNLKVLENHFAVWIQQRLECHIVRAQVKRNILPDQNHSRIRGECAYGNFSTQRWVEISPIWANQS